MTQITLCLLISKNAMITSLDAKSFKNTNCQLLSLTWLGIEISSGYSKYIDYQSVMDPTNPWLGLQERGKNSFHNPNKFILCCSPASLSVSPRCSVLYSALLPCMLCIPQAYEKWLLIQVFKIDTYSQLPV